MAFILGPENPALDFLRDVPNQFELRSGFIVVAWARQSGVGLLHSALAEHLRNVDVLVGMSNRGTSAEALAYLQTLSRRVFVYHKHHRQTFHPKLYLFDNGDSPPSDAAMLVGSSNLTGGGLWQNVEGNLVLRLRPASHAEDRAIYESVAQRVRGLLDSPFSEQLTSNSRIHDLLQDGYLSTEDELRRSRVQNSSDAARRGQRRQRPEAPPPRLPGFTLPTLNVNFVRTDSRGPNPAIITEGSTLLADSHPMERFYVRTLTANDVNKLQGVTPGTPEWDIGETARNAMPDFWGWPDKYSTVVRQRERLEWTSRGLLRSSSTQGSGVEVEIVIWHREQRPGHAAEHRLNIRPRATLLEVTPKEFNTDSLVVIERSPADRDYTFLVHLLTRNDVEYNDYSGYLRHTRPKHRYGYGP